MSELTYLGNKDLLKLPKTAFLASNTISSETVLHCYDWATEMRNQGKCVISGFSSKLEKDVLHFLLKGEQPIIMVLARRMYIVIPEELKEALNHNRLLIISTSNAPRQSRATALARNQYLAGISEKIYIAGAANHSSLLYFLQEHPDKCVEMGRE